VKGGFFGGGVFGSVCFDPVFLGVWVGFCFLVPVMVFCVVSVFFFFLFFFCGGGCLFLWVF